MLMPRPPPGVTDAKDSILRLRNRRHFIYDFHLAATAAWFAEAKLKTEILNIVDRDGDLIDIPPIFYPLHTDWMGR